VIASLPAAIGALIVGASLGLLGSGGSILCVPLLVYLVGHGEKQAIAESLLIVGSLAAAGTALRLRTGDIRWRAVLSLAPATTVGAIGGSALSGEIPGAVQLVLLAVLMVAAAGAMLRPPRPRQPDTARTAPLLLAVVGAGIGAVTGIVGIGGGFLIVPALVVLARFERGPAVGTSLALIAVNSAAGFTTHALTQPSHAAHLPTVGLFVGFGLLGIWAGGLLGSRVDRRTFGRVFAVLLALIGVLIIARETVGGLAIGPDSAETAADVPG
jgi:hypothetical protein